MTTKRRVVIVDDSEICRAMLCDILEADGDIEVVGEAADGARARVAIGELRPDLVTMDLAMEGEGGLDVIEWLMASHPIPILVVTGAPATGRGELVFEAIARGALEVIAKPEVEDAVACARARAAVRELSRVPVVRHVSASARAATRRRPISTRPPVDIGARNPALIVIGASAGGPAAVVSVLQQLPAEAPAVALVQHLPPGFAHGFARFLAHATQRRVVVVEREVATPVRGQVYVAPGDRHLAVGRTGALEIRDGEPVDGHRPSVTVLLRSAAEVLGPHAIGIVLTGIGVDGADGLVAMREAGALTITQDEASSAVFGMPRAARDRGGAERILPLDGIGAVVRLALDRSSP